jgi:argininosuccinate synthase
MTRIVLAYSGSLEATVAIRWLAAAHDAELR